MLNMNQSINKHQLVGDVRFTEDKRNGKTYLGGGQYWAYCPYGHEDKTFEVDRLYRGKSDFMNNDNVGSIVKSGDADMFILTKVLIDEKTIEVLNGSRNLRIDVERLT